MAQSIPICQSTKTSPKKSRFDRRKDEILNAAGVLINRHGLRDATLESVASEVGLNLKSLGYYFKRKEDLVTAAFLNSIDLHCELVEEALKYDNFEDRIRNFVRSYFALQARVYRKEQPEFVHFGDIRGLGQPQLDLVGARYTDLFRLTRNLFRKTGGVWTPQQHNANAHMLISQLFWSVVWIGDHVPEDFQRVAERLSDILLHGIVARPIDLHTSLGEIPMAFIDSEKLSEDSFLRAATYLINEYGYRGASVDRISAMLDVTKGAFYHHNDTRDGLVAECFERTFGIIRQAQDLAMAADMGGAAKVSAAAVSLVSRQMTPEGSLLRNTALTAVGPALRKELALRISLLTLRFSDMLNDGLLDGSVRICDIRISGEMVTAMINSAQELQRWVPSATAENATMLFVRPLLNGYLKTMQKDGA